MLVAFEGRTCSTEKDDLHSSIVRLASSQQSRSPLGISRAWPATDLVSNNFPAFRNEFSLGFRNLRCPKSMERLRNCHVSLDMNSICWWGRPRCSYCIIVQLTMDDPSSMECFMVVRTHSMPTKYDKIFICFLQSLITIVHSLQINPWEGDHLEVMGRKFVAHLFQMSFRKARRQFLHKGNKWYALKGCASVAGFNWLIFFGAL